MTKLPSDHVTSSARDGVTSDPGVGWIIPFTAGPVFQALPPFPFLSPGAMCDTTPTRLGLYICVAVVWKGRLPNCTSAIINLFSRKQHLETMTAHLLAIRRVPYNAAMHSFYIF